MPYERRLASLFVESHRSAPTWYVKEFQELRMCTRPKSCSRSWRLGPKTPNLNVRSSSKLSSSAFNWLNFVERFTWPCMKLHEVWTYWTWNSTMWRTLPKTRPGAGEMRGERVRMRRRRKQTADRTILRGCRTWHWTPIFDWRLKTMSLAKIKVNPTVEATLKAEWLLTQIMMFLLT